MKHYGLAAVLAAGLVLACGPASAEPAPNTEQAAAPMPEQASGQAADQALDAAWTAYNIGQYKKVVQLAQPLASEGNPRAQVLLARCYENGLGVPQDMETAAKWLRLAADQNYGEAQVKLAYLYDLGVGVPRDEKAVAGLMARAAEGGNAEAQFNLGLYYSQGRYGYPKDQAQSFAWALRSAEQGYAQAERYVGACYEHGVGVEQNAEQAALWYNRAARQGLHKEGSVFTNSRVYTMP
ncbi:MAG: sel1 repeat family protein [Desulfovibrio sp.]|nr:sel1 repeat family protein [Desulfovibrio sp.]